MNHVVIEQVPPDYYQTGVKDNALQKFWHTNKLNAALDLIPGFPKKILDVGCSSGWFLSKIAKRFPSARFYGIDVYDKALNYGEKIYPNIRFFKADAHKIPFKKDFFDLIVCTEVLEHLENPKKAILEIKRVLKKGSHAIIELDSGSLLFRITWFVWTRFLKGRVWNDAHLHVFNLKKLDGLLKSCGFQVIKKKKINFGMAMIFLVRR